MPLVDYNSKASFDETYRVKRDDGQPGNVGFERAGMRHILATSNATGIITALGLNNTHRIAVIGCGYGWLAKDIFDQCGATVIGVDTSAHIQATKGANADIDIYAIDVGSGQGRATVRQVLGIQGNNPASHAITEDVLTILSDAECLDLSAKLHILATTVVHWLTLKDQGGSQDVRFNWKTAAEWKALLPNDLFIQRSGNVLL